MVRQGECQQTTLLSLTKSLEKARTKLEFLSNMTKRKFKHISHSSNNTGNVQKCCVHCFWHQKEVFVVLQLQCFCSLLSSSTCMHRYSKNKAVRLGFCDGKEIHFPGLDFLKLVWIFVRNASFPRHQKRLKNVITNFSVS